ncbi:hypothetical protein SB6422_01607 [Klebsiella huaxiensis]|uniref:Uncharacterized protein n=1 Tax=Klebsiella huaxiensis TaxID=2153354 RepID=A0A564KCQ6_9ENTR|nr:hypothetical protein SB6422_01607 [Klebsiella huaxiensis]
MGELFHTLSRLHIFPEAVLRTCPGYRPVDDSEPVAGNLAGPQMQKSLLVEQAFQIWSVIEDDSPLRGSPCGPLLTQRSLASLESNLFPRRFSSSRPQMQKSLLVEQAFQIWSVMRMTRHCVARPAGRC